MMYTVGNTTAATSATLPNLQCNTAYTIWVYASGGSNDTRSAPIIVFYQQEVCIFSLTNSW